jgi:hypothetical protein
MISRRELTPGLACLLILAACAFLIACAVFIDRLYSAGAGAD